MPIRKKKPAGPKWTDIKADGWQNSWTGLGTDRDKTYQGSYFAPYRLMDSELLALFNGSDIAARICEIRPKEMMRRGYELHSDDAEQDELEELTEKFRELRGNELMQDGGVWGGLFGGAILIVGAEDGLTMDKPLNEDRIKTVRYLNLVDRRFVHVATYYSNPLSPKHGLAETYFITNQVSGSSMDRTSGVVIHESRVIRFDGARTDILTRQQLAGWSWSILQRPYDQLRAFESGFQAVGNLMSDSSQAVFKLQNLISMIASGDKGTLQARMQMVDMARSGARAILIDAENEDFHREPTTFTGLPDLLDRFMMRLSAACDIPVTILMGRSAAGMNATGDSDFRAFYDTVATQQENELAPKLKRIYKLLALAADSPLTQKDAKIGIKFHELWQPSSTEQAEIELKTAQKDAAYMTAGAISPEEVAMSRWGKGRFDGNGMSAFDKSMAERGLKDEKMLRNTVTPTPALAKQGAPTQQGEPSPGQALPGPAGGAAPAAGLSVYGATSNPGDVVKAMHAPTEPKPERP